MIDYILSIETSAVTAADLKKMKAGEVKELYETLKDTHPDEGDDEAEDEGTDECEEETTYKEHIRGVVFNHNTDILMDEFNKFFEKTTGYKVDSEMEQAMPINGIWINYDINNLKLWGNWDMSRFNDMNELELAKQIKEKFGFNV